MNHRLPIVALAFLAAACTAKSEREPLIRAPDAEMLAPPVNCIQTSRIRSTRVWDDYTIDFEMAGDEILRNNLPLRCPGLGFEERFAHSSSTAQLCSVDTITVLHSDSRRGAVCGLGEFVPIRYSRAAAD